MKQIFASNEQSNLIAALNDQSTKLNQFRKAFLFVCDHVGIRNGVQMWVEQSRRILMEIADKRNSQKTTEVRHFKNFSNDMIPFISALLFRLWVANQCYWRRGYTILL